jgi:hypothetical protein
MKHKKQLEKNNNIYRLFRKEKVTNCQRGALPDSTGAERVRDV